MFEVGRALVLVKLQPYKQLSVANRVHNKLCQKYFRSYEIEKKINNIAYKLKSKIHNTFHISRLKAFCGPIAETLAVHDLDTWDLKSWF